MAAADGEALEVGVWLRVPACVAVAEPERVRLGVSVRDPEPVALPVIDAVAL